MEENTGEYFDVGMVKNDVITLLDSDVAQSIDWIQHIEYNETKKKIILELFKCYHEMRKVVNSSSMCKYEINNKHFFNELLKNTLILIQCCNQFQLEGEDDDSAETNDILKRCLKESINLVSVYINDVRNETKKFTDLFSIDEERTLSHEKVKSGLIQQYEKIHEILKPMYLVMTKPSKKGSISKYIFDNYDTFNNMMISIKVCFKSTLMQLVEQHEEYEDVFNQVTDVVSNFIELQTILQKKIKDRNTSTKINSFVSKIKADINKIKGLHPDLYDKFPPTVINFLKMLTEGQNSSQASSSGAPKKRSKAALKDDPWNGKRTRKRSNSEKLNSSAGSSVDGEEPKKKHHRRPPNPNGGDSKIEFKEKHLELYPKGEDLISNIDIFAHTQAANKMVAEMSHMILDKYNVKEDVRKLVLEKVDLKNMVKLAKKSSGAACSSSETAVDLLDSFRNCERNVSGYYDKTKGDIIVPSDYCLRYSDGVYGRNAPYLILYTFFNFSDPQNPVALKLIPIYTLNKMISFKTLTVFIIEVNKRLSSGKELQLSKPEKKADEGETKVKEVDPRIEKNAKKMKKIGVNIVKLDGVKTIPAKLNARTKSILKEFMKKNEIDEKKFMDIIFPKLFHKKDAVFNDDYDLQGAIPQDNHMIEFMCFGNASKKNGKKATHFISFNSDLYKSLGYSIVGDCDSVDEVKQLYLYPTCMSIVRRFSSDEKPKQYQLFVVYDADENSFLSRNEKAPFGYVGFIEKNNVFRVIFSLEDIDAVTRSMLSDEGEEIELFPQNDHSVEYNREHDHWVSIQARNVVPSQNSKKSKQQKKEKPVNIVVKKNRNPPPKQLSEADLI